MTEPELTVTFNLESETKNPVRFATVVAEVGDPTQVGIIYISKAALKELGSRRGSP